MSWNLALSNLRPLDLGLTKEKVQMSHRKGEGHLNFLSHSRLNPEKFQNFHFLAEIVEIVEEKS